MAFTEKTLCEKEIFDGEKTYYLSTDFIKHLENKGEEIKLGNVYQFKIDSFGKIVYSSNVTDGSYVLCYKVYKAEPDDAVCVRFMDIEGVWNDLKVAKLEQFITKKGKMDAFKEEFESINGDSWENARDAFAFWEDDIVDVLQSVLGISETAARNWFNGEETAEKSGDR